MYAPLLLLLALVLPRAAPRLLGARMLSLPDALAALREGAEVAAWGGVLLTGGTAEDASPQALAVLRHAARHVRARSSCASLTSFALAPSAPSVSSASVVFSETGEGPTTIAVAIAGQPEGLGWDEIPLLGRIYAVSLRVNASACASGGSAALQEHNLTLSLSIPDSDVNVMAHTWREVQSLAEAAVGVDGSSSSSGSSEAAAAAAAAPRGPLRVLSYNTWNVNPPRWLHRDHRDRFRAYALRMHALGDLAREAGAGVIAFQEVRYDSTLGGFNDAPQTQSPWASGARSGPTVPVVPAAAGGSAAAAAALPPLPPLTPAPQLYAAELAAVAAEAQDPAAALHAAMPVVSRSNPYSLAVAWAVSSLWWNKTTGELSQSEGYRARNAEKWAAVTAAPGWAMYGGSVHPLEGEGAGAAEEGNSSSSGATGPGRSPYTKPPAKGPRSWSETQATFLDHPHAQIEHLAAALPGYQYVHVPAQLYLDKGVWGVAEGPGRGSVQRDEEGPAIFSQWPILHSDYLLLSRNTSDEGDTHQRLCLHALIDATPASPSARTTHVDVYTVHLSLSEAARNRTIPEVLAFIKSSARGDYVVLTGDMNAEPQEPALRALVAAGVIFVTPTPLPTPTPTPPPPAAEGALEVAAEDKGEQQAAAAAAALPSPAPSHLPPPAPLLLGKGGRDMLGLSTPLKEVHVGWDGEVVADGAALAAAAPGAGAGVPLLCDTWRALYPEPPQRDTDAAIRRYAFTFPSDDPVKRIDIVYAGCGPREQDAGSSSSMGGFLWQGGDEALARAQGSAGGQSVCQHMQQACGASVKRTWTVGQDSIPGTDMGEGKGFGMLGERSAWYASDHRGVVVELEVV